ncbi:MAG: c-type cytochrome [Bdellovibrio sp.]
MNKKTLSQGQQLFDIYCTACHGWTGHGDGIVIQRGYPAPISFHNDSFKTLPLDFYFNFISRGGTNMPPFSNKLSAEEIWTITYYIKALQLSENFPERLLNDEERKILRGDNE